MRVPRSALLHLSRHALGSCVPTSLLILGGGCNVFDEQLEQRLEAVHEAQVACRSHQDCAGDDEPHACVQPTGTCVPLRTDECELVTGKLTGAGGADAIVLGSLFSTSGPQSATNLARVQSAVLAIEEINQAGGVPSGARGMRRPLVLVSCDAARDLRRAGRHLVESLRVPAIIGPSTSQDTIDLSNEITVRGGALLLSPIAVASSIADLQDEGLTWSMAPTDVQRAPLLLQQIGALEESLRLERQKPEIKLSIIYRDDALGVGTRVALNPLVLNGKPIADGANLQVNVKLDRYAVEGSDRTELVDGQVQFAPDIVVIAGTSEAVAEILLPLEERWQTTERPHYVLVDALKGPELLEAVAGNEELQRRVRGTGIVPTARAAPVHDAFRVSYEARFPNMRATASGMGATYDATYAVALALAASHDRPPSGRSVAEGLRRVSGGILALELMSTNVLAAVNHLASGESIEAVGTSASLHWDMHGAFVGGLAEVWCVGGGPSPLFGSSGLTLDLRTGRITGRYRPCP